VRSGERIGGEKAGGQEEEQQQQQQEIAGGRGARIQFPATVSVTVFAPVFRIYRARGRAIERNRSSNCPSNIYSAYVCHVWHV